MRNLSLKGIREMRKILESLESLAEKVDQKDVFFMSDYNDLHEKALKDLKSYMSQRGYKYKKKKAYGAVSDLSWSGNGHTITLSGWMVSRDSDSYLWMDIFEEDMISRKSKKVWSSPVTVMNVSFARGGKGVIQNKLLSDYKNSVSGAVNAIKKIAR